MYLSKALIFSAAIAGAFAQTIAFSCVDSYPTFTFCCNYKTARTLAGQVAYTNDCKNFRNRTYLYVPNGLRLQLPRASYWKWNLGCAVRPVYKPFCEWVRISA